MNPEAQAKLDEILAKAPQHLDIDERMFLRARASYLKPSQVEEYKEVLASEEVKEEKPAMSYSELLAKAKDMGYKGVRMTRKQLEDYIVAKQANPFN